MKKNVQSIVRDDNITEACYYIVQMKRSTKVEWNKIHTATTVHGQALQEPLGEPEHSSPKWQTINN